VILVDTSAWVFFFQGDTRGNPVKELVLENGALLHPHVYGELLLGGLSGTAEELLLSLEMMPETDYDLVFGFTRDRKIRGSGIGWVDVNILVSALIHGCRVLTFDEKLSAQCRKFGCN